MGPRVHLERPGTQREREFLAAALRSRALHRGWVAVPGTAAEYCDYLRRARRSAQESFFVIATDDDALAGVIDIHDIAREPTQSGRLGYYAFVPFASRGLLRAGVELVAERAFRELGLHRLEANVQPGNRRSIMLLSALGFRREGMVRGYLKIGTRWRDHERWALLAEEWQAPRS